MRDAIKALLAATGEFAVVAEAETGVEAVQKCKEVQPDLALVDIGLPGGLNCIETTRELMRHCPDVPVIILSIYDDEESVVSAIRAGARAYVVKRAAFVDLQEALRSVARGGSYLSPHVSDRLMARIGRGVPAAAARHALVEHLAPRELQVFRLIVEGKATKEIAALLNLGVYTVRSYRKNMMRKLNVNNVAGLIQVAIAAGLIGKTTPKG